MGDDRRAIVVTVVSSQLEQVSRKWNQLPTKEPDKLRISQVVESLFNDILLLRGRGYSWEDICSLIEKDFKAKVAPITLQQHIRKISKARTEAEKGAKKKSKKQVEAVGSSPTATVGVHQPNQRVEASTQSELEPNLSSSIDSVQSTEDIHYTDATSESRTRKKEAKGQRTRPQASISAEGEKAGFNNLIMDHSKL